MDPTSSVGGNAGNALLASEFELGAHPNRIRVRAHEACHVCRVRGYELWLRTLVQEVGYDLGALATVEEGITILRGRAKIRVRVGVRVRVGRRRHDNPDAAPLRECNPNGTETSETQMGLKRV